jgi:hypothetical protein
MLWDWIYKTFALDHLMVVINALKEALAAYF